MIHNSRLQIFSGHPIRDAKVIYAQRAGEMRGRMAKRIWERAEPRLENICDSLLALGEAERKMGRTAYALKERGLDKFAFLLGRALNAEGIAEEAVTKCVEAHVAKARALGRIFFFWKLAGEMEEFKRKPNFLDEDGIPKPPRGGAVFQDAIGWYDGCGLPRYPIINGAGAVHIFNAGHRKP